MVSCRCGDQAALLLLLRKGADLVICAAHLISTGILHVLRFEVNLVSGCCGEILTVDQFGLLGHFLDFLRSLLKFFEG